eukprot:TRINITY_DN14552_c0_g2_i14.p1 TRINITY_DN14552_c0_g2~~TRINITY_DN14552_c0_g2_i14.p1  ORF type:complete len:204 (+),score=41.23 TRINITY_DN14552_c0_g2_i14:372-983(+)
MFLQRCSGARSLPSHPALAKKTRQTPDLTLVLDLDETLVHSSLAPITEDDDQITIRKGATDITVYVSIRPWARELLQKLAKYYEIVVFTASEKNYADRVMQLLDPDKKLVKYRLYRDSCVSCNQVLVKDLNVLGRDLTKTVIIDNNPSSFAFQNENGILIRSYRGNKNDTALLCLTEILEQIVGHDDIRSSLAYQFKLANLLR